MPVENLVSRARHRHPLGLRRWVAKPRLREMACSSLKPDPTSSELAALYTPTEHEKLLAARVGKRALHAYYCEVRVDITK